MGAKTKKAKWVRWLRVIGDDVGRLEVWRDAFETEWARGSGSPTGSDDPYSAAVREVYTHAMAIGIRRQLKLGSRNVSVAGLLEDLAASGKGPADPALVRRDLDALRRAAKPVEAFADRVVAHTDRRSGPMPDPETLGSLVDRLVALNAKYRRLIED